MALDFGKLVYVPDPNDGFQLGKLIDIGTETLTVELIRPKDSGQGKVIFFKLKKIKNYRSQQDMTRSFPQKKINEKMSMTIVIFKKFKKTVFIKI